MHGLQRQRKNVLLIRKLHLNKHRLLQVSAEKSVEFGIGDFNRLSLSIPWVAKTARRSRLREECNPERSFSMGSSVISSMYNHL
mmetsp:Transcript_13286/g.23868  ORF Transcript_13286/g.23868 Transcript_13286/m.23868 type:complete len:84 (+) Transcript_13286:894-1145(+)